jgi:hypothetical protein
MSRLNLATQAAVTLNDLDEAILRGFIETFPGLKYDYDQVLGHITVPFEPGKVFLYIVTDPNAPDRFRIKCAERHLPQVEEFVRGKTGFLRAAASDNIEGRDVDHKIVSVADPFAPGVPGGLLSDIAEFVLDTSPSPVREFATMSAVSFLAGYFGRRVLTPTGLGLNHYTALVAPTGFGKDRPLSALSQMAAAVGQPKIVGPRDFASDSAIEYLLRHRPCQVLPLDELVARFNQFERI